jgi:short-subunit dehydrogenase
VLKSPLLGRFVIGPERVAEAVLRAVEKDKRELTVPWFPYRLVSILQALAPGLVARFVGMSDYKTHPDEARPVSDLKSDT